MLFPKLKLGLAGKKPAAQTAKKGAAPRLELEHDVTGTRALAFGIQWRSIASAGGRDEAIRLARQAGATHYIFRGQQLGIGILPREEEARVFPAASVAARHMVGNAICALRIADGEYWIAAVANGAPTSTDIFLQGVDDAQALDRVRLVAAQVYAGASGGPTVYTNIEGSGLEGAKSFSSEDLFQALVSGSETLLPVPKPGLSVPKPVLAVAGVVAALLVVQQGWGWWQKQRAAQLAAQASSSDVDPERAWAEAISQWESSKAAANGYGLLQARDQLVRLPARWEGWVLITATCRAAPFNGSGNAAQRSWTCQAQYNREDAGVVNRKMATVLPANWNVQFTPLKGMTVSWNFVQPASQLKLAALPQAQFFKVEVASRLQELLPALASDVAFAFAPVEIAAPRKKDGTVVPPPPEAQGIAAATVVVKAPMRSIDALIKADVAADWQEISINFDNQEPKGSLKASTVMAEAKGEMYARN